MARRTAGREGPAVRRPYYPPAIRRSARVLRCLAESAAPVRPTDLAQQRGYGRISVPGLLRALEEVGWVEKDAEAAVMWASRLLAAAREELLPTMGICRPLLVSGSRCSRGG